jgi:dsDNA-binding SOS-regulon protein
VISIKYDDFGDNYELFVKLCEITSEPVRLVKEGCKDLIVMNAEAFDRRRKMLDLREKLIRASEKSPIEMKNISLDDLGKYINEIESESSNN